MGGFDSLSGIPVLGPVLSFLSNLFGSSGPTVQDLARTVGAEAQATWTDILGLATWSYAAFGGIIDSLGKELKKVWDELKRLAIDTIWGHIKAIFDAIRKWIENLRNWIKVHVAALQKIQRQLEAARAKQMKLILDVIQRIRKILVPFRLLHLGFATKLDATLARYESDLGAKWAKIIAFENQVLGVLNDVFDPRALMRPGHMLGSLGMMIGAVRGAIGALSLKDLLCLAEGAGPEPLAEPWSAYQSRLVSDMRGHAGDYAVYEAQRDQHLRGLADELGTASLA